MKGQTVDRNDQSVNHKTDSVDQVYSELAKGINISSDPEKTSVTFSTGAGLLNEYVDAVYSEISCYETLKDVTKDELHEYFCWLVTLRCWYTSGQRVPNQLKSAHFVVPAYLNSVLLNIGECYAPDQGIWLVPEPLKDQNDETVDPCVDAAVRKMQLLSNAIEQKLKAAGLYYADCLPLNRRDGNLDFMTFQLAKDIIWNETNKPAPLYALMSSLFGMSQMKEITAKRVSYGTLNQLRPLVRGVTGYERAHKRK